MVSRQAKPTGKHVIMMLETFYQTWHEISMPVVENQKCECFCNCENLATESLYTCAQYWKFLCVMCTYDETTNHFTCDLAHCDSCDSEFSPQCTDENCAECLKENTDGF